MLIRKSILALFLLALVAASQTATGQNKDKVADGAKDGKKEPPREAKGTPYKVIKVNAEKKQAVLQGADGKLATFKITDDTKFIGPRGGVSKDGIKDDRFVAGVMVGIVLDPKTKAVKEVHLPYRKGETDKKDKAKDAAKNKDKKDK